MAAFQRQLQFRVVGKGITAGLPTVHPVARFARPLVGPAGKLASVKVVVAAPAFPERRPDLDPGLAEGCGGYPDRVLRMTGAASYFPVLSLQWVRGPVVPPDGVGGRNEAVFRVALGAIDRFACESRLPGMRIGVAREAFLERGAFPPGGPLIVAFRTLDAGVQASKGITCAGVIEFLAIDFQETRRHMAGTAPRPQPSLVNVPVTGIALGVGNRLVHRNFLSLRVEPIFQLRSDVTFVAGDLDVLPGEGKDGAGMIEVPRRFPGGEGMALPAIRVQGASVGILVAAQASRFEAEPAALG